MNPCPAISQIEGALRSVLDPEIGINLFDLGTIYDIRVENGAVRIIMTLTTRHCPMHEVLTKGVETAVLQIPGIQSCEVQLVWDPPWNPSMISKQGKEFLGVK